MHRAARAAWHFALDARDRLRSEAGAFRVALGPRDGLHPAAPDESGTLSLVFRGRRFLLHDVATALGLSATSVTEIAVGTRSGRTPLHRAPLKADLLVSELPPWRRAARVHGHVFQTHVDEWVTLEPTMEAWTERVLGRDMRRKLKRAEQLGLRTGLGSAADLERFRETLLVPFTRHFHGERSHLPALDALRAFHSRGALLFARDPTGREWGGILVTNSREEGPRFLRTGLTLDVLSERRARDDVTAYLYAAFVRWAIERGAARASYGLSPAAASDGLVYFKARWGAEPCALLRGPRLRLSVRTPAADAWLRARGLYVHQAGRLLPYGEAREAPHAHAR